MDVLDEHVSLQENEFHADLLLKTFQALAFFHPNDDYCIQFRCSTIVESNQYKGINRPWTLRLALEAVNIELSSVETNAFS
jgi:hypothetical protein